MTVLDRHDSRPSAAGRPQIIDGPGRLLRRRSATQEWAAEVRRLATQRGRDDPGAQLPAARDPGRRRPRRRLAGAVADRGRRRPRTPSCSAACTSWPRPRRSSAPDKTVLIPDAAGRLLAGRLDHRRRAARLEGRAPRRRRRRLRQHHRRGEGRDRHLLHLVERRRGGRARSPPTARCCSCPDQFLGAHVRGSPAARTCTSGPASATCTPASTVTSSPRRPRAHPDAELFVHPECGCATSRAVPRRRGRGARRPGQDPVHRRHARRGPARRTPSRCWWPPRSACCTSCAGPHRASTSGPVNDRASCKYMKMITPAALLRCLRRGRRRGRTSTRRSPPAPAPRCSG